MTNNPDIIRAVHEANAAAHDEFATGHDRAVPYISKPRVRRYYWHLILDALANASVELTGTRVLEVGCGTGTFTDLFLLAGAERFVGLDLSGKMIEAARTKTTDPRATYVVGAVEDFAGSHVGEFDIIISASFLHHLVDPRATVRAIKGMLAPGGAYVAIHEQIIGRRPALADYLDVAAQTVAGYSGYARHRLPLRVALALCPPSAIRGLATRLGLLRPPTDTVDLVDYQLNHAFALRPLFADIGEITDYQYFVFPSLRRLSRQSNHQLLLVRSPN